MSTLIFRGIPTPRLKDRKLMRLLSVYMHSQRGTLCDSLLSESTRDSFELDRTMLLSDSRELDRTIPLSDSRELDRAMPLRDSFELDRTMPLSDSRELDRTMPLSDSRELDRTMPLSDSRELDRAMPSDSCRLIRAGGSRSGWRSGSPMEVTPKSPTVV